MSPARPARTAAVWQLLAGLGAGLAADLALNPEHRHVPLCPFHALTGLNCPLCGSLRATYALAHGRLGTAWHDNLLLLAALPVLAWWLADQMLRARRGQPARRAHRALVWGLVAVAVVFTAVRNLPGGQFLSPG